MDGRPDIIPGWPTPTTDQVRLFQANNGLEPDGDIGPKTRAALWRDEGSPAYTHLAWHRVERGGAKSSEAFAGRYLQDRQQLPLRTRHMLLVVALLTSEWKTGLDYLSTQDGITFGARRLAARTLRRFVSDHRDGFQPYLGVYDLARAVELLDDAPNNGWPLSDPGLRAGFIAAARDRVLWGRQLEDAIRHVADILEAHPWTHGRTLALAARAANSAPSFLRGLPRRDEDAYRTLVDRYSQRGATGVRRIARIEALVDAGEVWR